MTESQWAEVASFATQIEADFHRTLLENAGIPVLVKGPLTGAFGPGFAGATMWGVRLYVPAELVDAAAALLAGDAYGNGEPDDAA